MEIIYVRSKSGFVGQALEGENFDGEVLSDLEVTDFLKQNQANIDAAVAENQKIRDAFLKDRKGQLVSAGLSPEVADILVS